MQDSKMQESVKDYNYYLRKAYQVLFHDDTLFKDDCVIFKNFSWMQKIASEKRRDIILGLLKEYAVLINGSKYSFSSHCGGCLISFTLIDKYNRVSYPYEYSLKEFINVLNTQVEAHIAEYLYSIDQVKRIKRMEQSV